MFNVCYMLIKWNSEFDVSIAKGMYIFKIFEKFYLKFI